MSSAASPDVAEVLPGERLEALFAELSELTGQRNAIDGRIVEIVAEVERYIARPGQALAYKVGEIRIRALRREAERTLGARFDVREFHTQVLAGGSLPLPVLEEQIRRWLAR